jgi:hypothetical protein
MQNLCSRPTYARGAHMFGLDPALAGMDIQSFELAHLYIPTALFERIVSALQTCQSQYGTASSALNETGGERPISAVVPYDIMLTLPDHVCYIRRIFREYYKSSRTYLAGRLLHQWQNRDNIRFVHRWERNRF